MIKTEPVGVAATLLIILNAGIALGVAFGLPITEGQIVAVNAFAAAVAGLWTRSQVSPVADTPPWTPEMDS